MIVHEHPMEIRECNEFCGPFTLRRMPDEHERAELNRKYGAFIGTIISNCYAPDALIIVESAEEVRCE